MTWLGAGREWSGGSVIHGSAPEAPAPVAPHGRGGLRAEWRTAALPVALLAATPVLLQAPRGSGPVVDIPGWRSPEAAMAPLRGYLRLLGHDARGWGMGVNTGHPERHAPLLAEQVTDLAERAGRPVALIGWSLGGTIARETARLVPDKVRCVVTYGTPAFGGPTYTLGARTYGRAECERIADLIDELDATDPIRVPITAIFTRRDHVVSWPSCLDRRSADVEHVEVASTHLGMGLDPAVWRVVAERLAR